MKVCRVYLASFGTEDSAPVVKQPENEADHSSVPNAEISCVDLYLH